IEGPLALAIANTGADGSDHGLDLLVLENLVEAGLLDVDELAADGQDRLGATVPSLLGGATGGVTLDDVDFAFGRVTGGTVGQFAGETSTGHGGFANRLPGLAGGLAGACGVDDFVDDLAGQLGVFLVIGAD